MATSTLALATRRRAPTTVLAMLALILVVPLMAACGGAGATPTVNTQQVQTAEVRAIEGQFHEALTTKNLDLMMSLWAADATLTTGGHTYTGADAIRNYFATTNAAFKAENNWIVLTAGWRIIANVTGDTGNVQFECYFVDVPTKTIKLASAANADVVRQSGRWLIHTFTSKPFTVGA